MRSSYGESPASVQPRTLHDLTSAGREVFVILLTGERTTGSHLRSARWTYEMRLFVVMGEDETKAWSITTHSTYCGGSFRSGGRDAQVRARVTLRFSRVTLRFVRVTLRLADITRQTLGSGSDSPTWRVRLWDVTLRLADITRQTLGRDA